MDARAETPLPLHDYSILNLIAFVTYPPLYIAGPIPSFNSFIPYVTPPPPPSPCLTSAP